MPAQPDDEFDRLAAEVARRLSVPQALMVLVSKGGQVFPGVHGLREPWTTRRSSPLSLSMSQLVVRSGQPLVVPDTGADPVLRDSAVVRTVGIVAYAGMPLWNGQGRPIGVLAAVDDVPREWSADDLTVLYQLAAECSRRLQFRALELADQEARAAAAREAGAARQAAQAAQAAYVEAEVEADRTRLVARFSGGVLAVDTMPDVLRAVDRLVRSPLGAAAVLVGVAESGRDDLHLWATSSASASYARPAAVVGLQAQHPLAEAVRERRVVPVPAPEEIDGGMPAGRAQSALAVPVLLTQHEASSGLLVTWGHPRELDPPLCSAVTDLAGHLGHALDRVLLRDQRLRLEDARPGPARAAAIG
ncbi:GAF domain-containing protein [Modestobacter roseus]|uniref:GAF domain-containing protein n=1 Tax=Modestobacter roseus TaxID=1181884 RepID=UPI001E2DACD0|nr:GAF domain-containing protein [Modestobacter roseus]